MKKLCEQFADRSNYSFNYSLSINLSRNYIFQVAEKFLKDIFKALGFG